MPASELPRQAIIVAGHSVVVDFSRVEEDAGWALLDFQRGEHLLEIGVRFRIAELQVRGRLVDAIREFVA